MPTSDIIDGKLGDGVEEILVLSKGKRTSKHNSIQLNMRQSAGCRRRHEVRPGHLLGSDRHLRGEPSTV